jgi:hypothetical protein
LKESRAATWFSEILELSSLAVVVMQFPVLLPGALYELFAQASDSGCMTTADRYGLMAAILDGDLGTDERNVIDRLLRAARRGRIVIVDEVSAQI